MRFISILLLFTILAAVALTAAYPKHLVGVDYSTISGSGLSYSLELDRSNVLKFSGILMYYGPKPPDKMTLLADAGMEYQYNIWKIKNNRLYLFGGGSYWYVEKRDVISYMKFEKLIIEKTIAKNNIFNIGAGIGYEKVFLNKIALNLNIGLQYQLSDGEGFPLLFDRSPESQKFIGVGGGIGLKFIIK
ncbi:MAG: hypothetical protein WCR42_01545 [bacterium]